MGSTQRGGRGASGFASIVSGPPSERSRFALLLFFFLICFLTGGSSKADELPLLVLRPIAVLCLTAFFLIPGKLDLRSVRAPLWLLAAFAATIGLQLVPLPPSAGAWLAGREAYALGGLVHGAASWHPISLTPDRTWNSLIALLVPLTMLIGYSGLRPDHRVALLPALVVLAFVSAVLGVAQLSGGEDSPLYFYTNADRGLPAGFFGNRNHEAVLLAMTLPLLRAWTLLPGGSPPYRRNRAIAAAVLAFLVVPMILVTGSRSGTLAMLLGAVGAFLLRPRLPGAHLPWRLRLAWPLAALAIAIGLAAVFVVWGRALAVDRLFGIGVGEERRVEYLPLTLSLVRRFLPIGSGFGSFDPVFRSYEPLWALKTTYFNNAHNDLVELALTGGILPIAVLTALMFWWGRRSIAIVRMDATGPVLLARCAAIMILMLLLASLTDYPLRTPAMGAVFALACAWLADRSRAHPVSSRVRLHPAEGPSIADPEKAVRQTL